MKVAILLCFFLTWVHGETDDVEEVENFESVFRQRVSSSCRCGRKNENRIVGGNPVRKHEYPWMVAICFGSPCNFDTQFCGGSLINDQFVLTASHCLEYLRPRDISVSLGDHNLASAKEADSTEFKVARIIMHDAYDDQTLDNDIALIKLSKKVKMTNAISPICLPTSARLTYQKEKAFATGWGKVKEDGVSSKVLKDVAVTVQTNRLCSKRYGKGVITNKMLCASRSGKDSCQGDSGGPLIFSSKNAVEYQQIGIVSFGYGCAAPKYPGVYTRVGKYLKWIRRKTRNAKYCRK